MIYEKHQMILKDFEKSLKIEEMLADNSVITHVVTAKQFLYAFKDKEIKDIELTDIRAYLAYHKEKQLWTTKNTFLTKIESLRKFFNFCEKEGIVADNPIRRLRRPHRTGEQEIQALTPKEFQKMLKVLHTPMFSTRDRAIFHLLASTGMRVGEVLNLQKDHYLNLRERKIFIPKTKTNIPKYIKFSEAARYFLEQYMIKDKLSNSRYIFHQKRSEKPLTNFHIWRVINKLIKTAFPLQEWKRRRGPHLLRHTFAMDWIRHDGHLKGLQWIMGWTSLKMTEVYQKQTEELIDTFYDKYEKNKKKKKTLYNYKRRR